jgi:hypothetical protein
MKNRFRIVALMALVGLISAFVMPVSPAQAQVTTPVEGSCVIKGEPGPADNLAGTFEGTFEITRFIVRQGQLFARGTLEGVCTATSDPTVTETVNRVVRIPVNVGQSSGSCEILDLVLGPLDLDLLGLVVHLDTVHLNITAEQGPGNLLGNLLCAVAGLLDNTGATPNALATLLNRILSIIG